MDGNGLNNKFLNKSQMVLHKMPLIERILGVFSAIFLMCVPIICLYLGYENKKNMIFLLIASIVYCVIIYFDTFKTYICFDPNNEKIVIRHGLEKKEICSDMLIDFQVEDDPENKKMFILKINFVGRTVEDHSWSTGYKSRVMFGSLCTQRKRLEQFCNKCNSYLSKSN